MPPVARSASSIALRTDASAIYLDDDVPEEHRADIARNAAFFKR